MILRLTSGVETVAVAEPTPGGPAEPDPPPQADLARTCHELRTPLQAIVGFTGTLLLRLPGPLNDEQERQLLLIQASAQQLLSLINELSLPSGR